jgi:hypothetical protein
MKARLAPREHLRELLLGLTSGRMPAARFCAEFSLAYDYLLDRETLSAPEAEALAKLADVARWYSPNPEERAWIPDFRDEADVANAAALAAERLIRHPQAPNEQN